MLQNVSTVARYAVYAGIGAMGLIAVLAVFVGETVPRRGFLPWPTSWGDRFFVSLLIFFMLALVWMRFIEPFIPIYWVVVAGLAIGAVIVKWG